MEEMHHINVNLKTVGTRHSGDKSRDYFQGEKEEPTATRGAIRGAAHEGEMPTGNVRTPDRRVSHTMSKS